ncbi:dynein regulatory complex subunit 2 [Stomoxys calcitrans]|uniref:dynein regulatory complex subunit 2 n=1 Tax=Stomoxys calcitrans TaxID=35570 RepID=UPI0027E27566|nr:dynein regulatory complex subunit 2 [Stomoxys calcitrans]
MNHLADEVPKEDATVKKQKKKLSKKERKGVKRGEDTEFHKLKLYDELRRESALAKKTSIRNEEKWLEMCPEIKLAEMREELTSWQDKTNRILVQKDEKIQLILEEIKETEEMQKRNFGMQLQIMDYLSDTFKLFQEVARQRYEEQAQEMIHDFFHQFFERKAIDAGCQRKCENVMHATNLIVAHTLREDYDIYLDKREDRVSTEIVKRYELRDAVAKKMQKLQSQLVEFVERLRNTSLDDHKYKRFKGLMQRQRTFVIKSRRLSNTEAHHTRLYKELQKELNRVEIEDGRKIQYLKLQQTYFVNLRRNIEEQMSMHGELTHEKLKILTLECYRLSKHFNKLEKYGELLLSLVANCRKLQTESEKVVPWGDFSEPINYENSDEKDDFTLKVLDLESHVDQSEKQLKSQMELMKNFWRRQALAEAQIVLLEERKRKLLEEKESYINKIKSLSKADDVNEVRETLQVKGVLDEKPFNGYLKPKCHL